MRNQQQKEFKRIRRENKAAVKEQEKSARIFAWQQIQDSEKEAKEKGTWGRVGDLRRAVAAILGLKSPKQVGHYISANTFHQHSSAQLLKVDAAFKKALLQNIEQNGIRNK